MERPAVVLNVFSSVDGRITTAPGLNVNEWTAQGLDGGADYECHRLFDELGCDGIISGSETIMVWGRHPVRSGKPGYWPRKSKGFIVFDGRGRVTWTQTTGLIVVTREDVSPDYVEQLKAKGVPHILAGREPHIDLGVALEGLYAMGFRRLGLSGGGGINGAFLRAGLIDEMSLVIAPLAVGGLNTPSILDAPDLESVSGVTRLELIETRPVGQGSVWVHYRVVRAPA